jgi:23S rRNA G2445 N2-methylase RlmL
MARPSTPLAERARERGFTPSVRDLDPLVDLLANDELQKDAERAIVRAGPTGLDTLKSRFEGALPPLRGRILRVIGRFVLDDTARSVLVAALRDADPKTRRNAAMALGHAERSRAAERSFAPRDTEAALLRTWDEDPRTEMRRTLAAALGKVGTPASLSRLTEAAHSEDAELARIAKRAVMIVERTASRGQGGGVVGDRVPARPVSVQLLSRRGLESVLADELSRLDTVTEVQMDGPGRVRARLLGPLDTLMSARTMLELRFVLPSVEIREGESATEAIALLATSDLAQTVLGTWSGAGVRYRIQWQDGGHKRAATWAVAQAIGRRQSSWINDPTASSWEFVIDLSPRSVQVAIVPRGLADPRFTWRRGDVPASSHPTIAAALAWVAGVRDDDVVWDPFVGSGSELVERAKLGPFASLTGTDVDARALRVARENLSSLGLSAHLEQTDALTYAIRPTLVITNPPMGRRASRMAGLKPMLDRFVLHVAEVLVPGGRFVWMAPWPLDSRRAAATGGLSLDWARLVDMDGFDAELQSWHKR